MSTHNICFYGKLTKIIPKLSSNTLLICYTTAVIKMSGKCLQVIHVFCHVYFDLISHRSIPVILENSMEETAGKWPVLLSDFFKQSCTHT